MGSHMNLLVKVNKRTDSSSAVIAQYWPRDKSINADDIGKHLLGRIQRTLSN